LRDLVADQAKCPTLREFCKFAVERSIFEVELEIVRDQWITGRDHLLQISVGDDLTLGIS